VGSRSIAFSDPDGRCGPFTPLRVAAAVAVEGGGGTVGTLGTLGAGAYVYRQQIGQGLEQLGQAADDLIAAAKKKLKPGVHTGLGPLDSPVNPWKLPASTGTPSWYPPDRPPKEPVPQWRKDWQSKAVVVAFLVATAKEVHDQIVDNVPRTPSKEPNNKT
ncbi:MAG: hypothetical protein M1582_01650, partial [Actinobacteria bacterium]|nr:hypothetical protein [Actinomycetota bacterium]